MHTERLELAEFDDANPESHSVLRGVRLARSVQQVRRVLSPLLQVDELRTGLRIRTSDFTGAASFVARTIDFTRVQFRVIVRPRNPHLSLADVLGMLAVVELGRWRSGILPTEGGLDQFDALCRAMVSESRRLVRRGLARSYVSAVADLKSPKGHVDPRMLAIRLLLHRRELLCRYSIHTLESEYNQYVAAGLDAARRTAANRKLRRAAARLEGVGVEVPRRGSIRRPAFYGGQYAEYRTPHDIAALLLDGLGLGGHEALRAAFVPFVVETNLLFQKFLTQAIAKTVGPRFEVRSERIRVFERLSTTKERAVIPDIVVRDQATGRVVLVVDAKYETTFPAVSAGDYYQAYVYGDVMGRMNEPRPLPVALAGPFSETSPIDWQRVPDRLDARGHKPVTWLVGVNVSELLRSIGGKRPIANEALKAALTATGATLS